MQSMKENWRRYPRDDSWYTVKDGEVSLTKTVDDKDPSVDRDNRTEINVYRCVPVDRDNRIINIYLLIGSTPPVSKRYCTKVHGNRTTTVVEPT